MDSNHVEILKTLVPSGSLERMDSSAYWIERSKKSLAITTQDRDVFPVIDHTHCQGSWLHDLEGRKYFDVTSGVAVRALGFNYAPQNDFERKIANIPHELPGQDFDNIPHVLLAEKLLSITPRGDERQVVFTTSGARAVEGAMKSAMDVSGKFRFVAFRPAFHGRTGYAMALTASNHLHKDGYPQGVDVIRVDYPYCYHCPFGRDPKTCHLECAQAIEVALEYEGTDIAAVFFEPICGEGGIIVPPQRFAQQLRRIVDKYETFLAVDEVQAGMGRTGKWWAIENFGVTPDYICSAKALGGGYNLGATIGKTPMFTKGSRHSQTVSAEPRSALASLFVLNEIERKGLLNNARDRGEQLLSGLRKIQKESPCIGDVRGIGLMIGVEFVKDKDTKEAAKETRHEVVKNCVQKQGLWVLGSGQSTIRFLPCLLITKEEVDLVLERFANAVTDVQP